MKALGIQLLGGLRLVAQPARPITLPAKKVQALLAYLALQPGRPHGRAKMAALLWSDSDETAARASLRQALLVLRRALELDDDALVASADSVTLSPDGIDVDAIEFERRIADGSASALERAAELYGGDLLDGLDAHAPAFDDWLLPYRRQLRERALQAFGRLLALHIAAGRGERAIAVALRVLALDPLAEPVHRTLMELYAQQGRHAAALRQYTLCRELLQRELGQPPQAQTEQLRDAIERRRTAAPPACAVPEPAGDGAELRPIAVLSVDAPAIADEIDPERAQAQCERLAAAGRAAAARCGGTLDAPLGASLRLLFGVPQAHGDDVVRATRCALQLRDALPGLRLGVAAGTVLHMPNAGTTGGEVAAEAMRLAALATPGEVRVADAAWRALRDADGRACGDGAWRLDGLRAAVWRGALVGRRAELAQFTSALRACRDSGAGLLLHLRGEPGIGKTRLVEEFAALAGADGYACHRGAVLDFGGELDPVRAIVRGLLGVADADSAAESAAIARALASGAVERADEPHLHELLQRPQPAALQPLFDAMDAATRARGQRDVLAHLLQHCGALQPRLVIVEDLHWADERTLAHLAALAAACERCAALLVSSARSDGDPLGAAWRGAAGVGAVITLDLGPLRWAEASTLAAQWSDAADPFTLRCVERAGGNPLFLEQLLRAGDSADTLPGSVQSVVAARLDRLGTAERHAVRVASVLGQRFSRAALAHLLDAALDAAPAHGLLHVEGDAGVFAHALVHEGAYASLPEAQRGALHRRAADWYAGRDASLRAEHLARAGDPAAAAAYLDAAREQAAQHRHERALRLAERGLALAADDSMRGALAACRAELLHDAGAMRDAHAAWQSALALASDAPDRCRAWLGLAAARRVLDDLPGAADALAEAERVAREHRLIEPLARVHFLRGNVLFPQGDFDGCAREHRRSLKLARQARSLELEAQAQGGIGDAEYMRGRMASALARYGDCVALARRHGFARIEAANLPMVSCARWYAGNIETAMDDALQAIAAAQRIGHLRAEMIAQHGAYMGSYELGRFADAAEHAESALDIARQLDAPRFVAEALAFRGCARRALGERGAALADLREALAIARATGMAYLGPTFLGMLAHASDDADERRAALAEGEALLAGNALAHNHLLFHRDAVDACLAAGDAAEARRHADALEARTRDEPSPWATFFAARGRALAAMLDGAGDVHERTTALAHLHSTAQRLGLLTASRALAVAAGED